MTKGYINVTVVGTLGKDPEVRSTQSGKRVANFSVAVDQGFGDSQKTEWVNVVCWERLAELAEKFLKKGKEIGLSGTLQTQSWDDKQSGQKRYKTEVVARDITFLDGERKSGSGGDRAVAPAARRETPAETRAAAADPFADDGSEIPF